MVQLSIRFSRRPGGMWPLWCHFSGAYQNLGWWNYGRRISQCLPHKHSFLTVSNLSTPQSSLSPVSLFSLLRCLLSLSLSSELPYCPLFYPLPLAAGAGKQARQGFGLGFSSWWKLIPSGTDLGKVPSSCSQKTSHWTIVHLICHLHRQLFPS